MTRITLALFLSGLAALVQVGGCASSPSGEAGEKKGLKVVYMQPKEKPIAWVGMFMLLKGSPRPDLAHAYVDAWSSTKSGKWLEDNYGYGHANTLARPASSDLLKALQLTNPRAVTEPYAHLDRDIPRRATYANLWEQVKAS